MRFVIGFVSVGVAMVLLSTAGWAAGVKPGDVITPDNASAVADLISPGNLFLVKQGMRMKIVPTSRLEWPPPYIVTRSRIHALPIR
ncbi:MAG: hypothetical protein ACLQAT_31115 [Candidatus Binataceae bacterium]